MEEIKQFDIWTCDFSRCVEYADFGIRPCVIVSNNACNSFSGSVTIVPLTTQNKSPLPTHCIISSSKITSFALCEDIITVLKVRLKEKVAELNEFERANIIYCLKQQLNIQ